MLGTRPLVHSGFLASWNGAGLDEQVLLRVQQVLEQQAHDGADMAPLANTVVRCCSKEHEQRSAELAAAAAEARATEAAALAGEHGAMAGGKGLAIDEEGLAAAAAAAARHISSSAVHAPASSSGWGGFANGGAEMGGSGSSQLPQPFRIYITGHSLGGAVGTLCAFELARRLPQWGFAVAPTAASPPPPATERRDGCGARPAVSVSVYTYGAPRTGNHAFAREYGQAVPDTWSVINDQDMIAKSAKFWVLFKRPGHVALINPQGDLIVNPSEPGRWDPAVARRAAL